MIHDCIIGVVVLFMISLARFGLYMYDQWCMSLVVIVVRKNINGCVWIMMKGFFVMS